MISRIEGIIILKTDKYAVVDVSGVGYKINLGSDTLAKLPKTGDQIAFFTHLHVREDALDLYGFMDIKELEFFEMLINISGIGPKSALGVIGVAPIEILKKAIASGDTSYLTKVSGIGKKMAEKIILELRDKLSALGHKAEFGELSGELDSIEALKSLGYSQNEAREALKLVPPELISTSDRVKQALKILGGK
ncbi:MAG: Holliday junction ATP-dependent DNA helicase RuvA [Candidatus Nomurabacteria bacterium GW2011_GWB1_37_5]|uniref:Holliday junction branch migration complex subunit RuvA n=1 Tax=Candidatus Nomurabacteria bacterium GW2011_GWB1_37_5 TaxID=1618742 RepID=A0A0G0GXL4_9BACT|nr:MAG: Holliday junction ATP-dependent DNA helicase RuvA [Candidatus Nomurabacteria bacterium GW2011_GWB1_37_5]